MMYMELFGFDLPSIYLTVLIGSGICVILTLLLSDLFGGDVGIFNPTLILAFFTILSASGYLMEKYSTINSIIILSISAIIALIISSCLHLFVFIPLANAEESLVYSDESLKGRIGKVITTIPKDGYGEILIESISGNISKTAASFYNEEIGFGEETVVVEIKENVAYVVRKDGI
ncbi:membrane integrity integral inner membrane protein [Niallia circulans]|jgi:membrane-bound ClpP family serine protease|nr:membrane integrity integral inner membrane protein [Niallia circulans]